MTDNELRDAAVAALKATTISYPEWVKRRDANRYPDITKTKWWQSFDHLDKIGAVTPPPPSVGYGVRETPRGTLNQRTGSVFLRDGDGALTERQHITASPDFGFANMRWPFVGLSSGTWVVRDCRAENVASNGQGTDGAGLWGGEKALVERCEFNGDWMGGTFLAAGMGSRVYDTWFTSPRTPLYPEHPAHDVEFHYCTFGPKYGTTERRNSGASINAEWWHLQHQPYSDYLARLLGPITRGLSGTHDLRFYNCDIWCPPIPDRSVWNWYLTAGAMHDAGTFGYRFERCRFWGPGLARAIPSDRLMIDPSRPNVAVDCLFENTGGQVHVYDNRRIG